MFEMGWIGTYLLAPVTRTNKVSFSGARSQGGGTMVSIKDEQCLKRGRRSIGGPAEL